MYAECRKRQMPPHLQQPADGRDNAHRIRTVIAHDVDEHAHNLTNWEQSYDQIAPGPFRGALVEWRTPPLQIFRESTSRAIRQSCRVWPDAFWFGMEPDAGSAAGGRINGRPGGAAAIMVRPGNCEFELMTPDNYEILGIVVDRNELLSMAVRLGCEIEWSRLASAELLHVAAAERSDCLHRIVTLLAADNVAESQHESLPETVIMALLAMLDTGAVETAASNSFIRRRRIVGDARDYILSHHEAPITVPLLCEKLHVSRRTLQYCFENVLNISPMAYLRMVRLNGARRHLREGAAGRSVGGVAQAWGFGNFSQFSSDYKKLFGESPSASLMTGARHPGRALPRPAAYPSDSA